jgi:tetratricopeptide (TPR) repeat protein
VSGAKGYDSARKAAQRALELDPSLASAHMSLAWVQASEFEWAAAESSFRKALALEPNNALVLQRSGFIAAEIGRTNEGEALLRKSIERDPLDLAGYRYLGYLLTSVGRPGEAEAVYRKAQELSSDPNSWSTSIADALLMQGRAEEALREAEKSTSEEFRALELAYIYHTLGRRAESDAAIALLEGKYGDSMAFYIAQAHAWRGESDLAFAWLERALKQHDPYLSDFKLAWDLRLLKNDPRYNAFLKKLNFPE